MWLESEGINNLTEEGNLKAPPRRAVLPWTIEAWDELPKQMIISSFKSCAINLSVDGKEVGLIRCFEKGELCASGQELLNTQAAILNEPGRNQCEENILQLEGDVDYYISIEVDSDRDATVKAKLILIENEKKYLLCN